MATRPEVLQSVANLFGNTLVTMENHARSLGVAPGRYCTAIGRGNRNVDQGPDYITSIAFAAIVNDPKNAASKVPSVGELQASEARLVRYWRKYEGSDDVSQLSIHAQSRPFVEWSLGETVVDLVSRLVDATGRWIASGAGNCPIPSDFRLSVTIEPAPSAVASFRIVPEEEVENIEWRAECRYFRDPLEQSLSRMLGHDQPRPIERSATISDFHILTLGKIFAHTLIRQRPIVGLINSTPSNSRAPSKGEEADNLPGSSASSEPLSHDDTRTETDTPRKTSSPNSADPIACVCPSSSGFETPYPRSRTHDPAPHHYALLEAAELD